MILAGRSAIGGAIAGLIRGAPNMLEFLTD